MDFIRTHPRRLVEAPVACTPTSMHTFENKARVFSGRRLGFVSVGNRTSNCFSQCGYSAMIEDNEELLSALSYRHIGHSLLIRPTACRSIANCICTVDVRTCTHTHTHTAQRSVTVTDQLLMVIGDNSEYLYSVITYICVHQRVFYS